MTWGKQNYGGTSNKVEAGWTGVDKISSTSAYGVFAAEGAGSLPHMRRVWCSAEGWDYGGLVEGLRWYTWRSDALLVDKPYCTHGAFVVVEGIGLLRLRVTRETVETLTICRRRWEEVRSPIRQGGHLSVVEIQILRRRF